MYHLIFADDEALVRNNIARLIDWNKSGFSLIGCCANGHELLDMVEREQPDLVITDINMPFISGIDAARQLKQDYPAVKVAFLTGYNDFQYAQQAIDLKVMKYILKPVTAANLTDALSEIKRELDQEFSQNSNLSMLQDFYEQNKAVMQSVYLNRLLENDVKEKEAKSHIESLGLNWLSCPPYQTAVLLEDGNRFTDDWKDVSQELIHFAIYNIAKEIVESARLGSAILTGERVILLMSGEENPKNFHTFEQRVEQCVGEILSAVKKYLKFTITAGIGKPYHCLRDIHNSYDEAVSALGYRQTQGNNCMIFIEDIEPQRHQTPIFDKSKETQLLETIKQGSHAQLLKVIDYLFSDFDNELFVNTRIYAMGLLLSILREAENIGLDTQKLLELCDMKRLAVLKNMEELRKIILTACHFLSEGIKNSCRNTCSDFVLSATQYIKDHYSDPKLSVDMVSGYLHLSSSYFRSIFKKELGTTFINYLTQTRMEQAINLMRTTELKNYEISEKIGYSDPHYFSYCFKHYYNMAPNEMREKLKNEAS